MRSEDVREFLKRQPFQPFRLTLTDGRSYDVMHPELAVLGRNVVAVGLVPPGASEDVANRIVHVDLLHVMQIENLETAQPPASP